MPHAALAPTLTLLPLPLTSQLQARLCVCEPSGPHTGPVDDALQRVSTQRQSHLSGVPSAYGRS